MCEELCFPFHFFFGGTSHECEELCFPGGGDCLGLSVLGPGVAFGTVIASDSFDYATGNLAGDNGGTGWSGAWDNLYPSALVASPGLTYAGVVSSGNATQQLGTGGSNYSITRRVFQTPIGVSNNNIWISFLAKGVNSYSSDWGGVSLLVATGVPAAPLDEREAVIPHCSTGYWGLYGVIGGAKDSTVPISTATHLMVENLQFGGRRIMMVTI